MEFLYYLATVDGKKLHIVVGPSGKRGFCGDKVTMPPDGKHALRTIGSLDRICLRCLRSTLVALRQETDETARTDLMNLLENIPAEDGA